MRQLFPEIEPYNSFRFKASLLHELYVEEVGNPKGQPVVFLHGGPGGGISKSHRRLFDPKHYRIVLFDQRGAGKSTPFAELKENTTWDLVEDMEKLRKHLDIERWLVFGGSWGSTLALAYAQTHPQKVTGLILRGIFMCRPSEIEWFYQDGAEQIFPDLWEKYVAPIPPEERHQMVRAYYKRLTSPEENVRLEAARAWSTWEGSTLSLLPNDEMIATFSADQTAVSLARIECHYFLHDSWFKPDQLLNDVSKIKHIPAIIVHGRYDVVCPVKSAWDLHRVWPESKLQIIPDAGHAYNEPGILNALIAATEDFKGLK
ncbi:MAG: prolyl aminopeptidase [Bdellovibrionales bacterium]